MNTQETTAPVLTIQEIARKVALQREEEQRQKDEAAAREMAGYNKEALENFLHLCPNFAAACEASGISYKGDCINYLKRRIGFSYQGFWYWMGIVEGGIMPEEGMSYANWHTDRLAEILYSKLIAPAEEWAAKYEPKRLSENFTAVFRNYRRQLIKIKTGDEDYPELPTAILFAKKVLDELDFAHQWAPNVPYNITQAVAQGQPCEALKAAQDVESDDMQDYPW